jgi:hypothetical protein
MSRINELRVNHAIKGEILLNCKLLSQQEIIKVGIADCDLREGRENISDGPKLVSFMIAFLSIAIENPPEWADWKNLYEKEDREFMAAVFEAAHALQRFS